MQAYTITPMQLEDIEPATHMRLASWLDTYVNNELGVTREWIEARNRQQLSPEKVKARKERFSSSHHTAWVAKDENGVIIGSTTPYIDDNGIQHLGSLYVDKTWHGKGVASELMKRVIAWSDPKKPMILGVVSYNERAKAFYRKWGFKEIPQSETLFDDKIPEIMMERKGDQQ